jgi:hypothetical protein
MYYEGDNTKKITIGRDMGWNAISNVDINGTITGTPKQTTSTSKTKSKTNS